MEDYNRAYRGDRRGVGRRAAGGGGGDFLRDSYLMPHRRRRRDDQAAQPAADPKPGNARVSLSAAFLMPQRKLCCTSTGHTFCELAQVLLTFKIPDVCVLISFPGFELTRIRRWSRSWSCSTRVSVIAVLFVSLKMNQTTTRNQSRTLKVMCNRTPRFPRRRRRRRTSAQPAATRPARPRWRKVGVLPAVGKVDPQGGLPQAGAFVGRFAGRAASGRGFCR